MQKAYEKNLELARQVDPRVLLAPDNSVWESTNNDYETRVLRYMSIFGAAPMCGSGNAECQNAVRAANSYLDDLRTGLAVGMTLYQFRNFGDLTPDEIKQIQSVVDRAGRPLNVVGSAVKGGRRGVGTDLPVGKGPGSRSDIDYTTAASSVEYFKDVAGELPALDPIHGILQGAPEGRSIRFEPGTDPYVVGEEGEEVP